MTRRSGARAKRVKVPVLSSFAPVPSRVVACCSGAVKITPAHDPNDYAVGQRHKLPFINILTDDGAINSNGGKFAGMMRYDAREAILNELRELGLFRDIKDNPMSIPLCRFADRAVTNESDATIK